MAQTRSSARHSSTNSARITASMRQRYGPQEPEYRGPQERPSPKSADLTLEDMVRGFVEDPEFRAMVEDEARIAMFGGRGGRNPLR